MSVDGTFSSTALITAQFLLAATGFLAMLLVPPASGKIMLIPVMAGSDSRLPAIAVDHGARLVGAGPFRRSLVVEGSRSALIGTVMRAGGLILAAPPTSCADTSNASTKII